MKVLSFAKENDVDVEGIIFIGSFGTWFLTYAKSGPLYEMVNLWF